MNYNELYCSNVLLVDEQLSKKSDVTKIRCCEVKISIVIFVKWQGYNFLCFQVTLSCLSKFYNFFFCYMGCPTLIPVHCAWNINFFFESWDSSKSHIFWIEIFCGNHSSIMKKIRFLVRVGKQYDTTHHYSYRWWDCIALITCFAVGYPYIAHETCFVSVLNRF